MTYPMQPNYVSEFDDLFERMNRSLGTGSRSGGSGDFAVDIAHYDDEIVVTADVPGFEREALDVSIDDDRLTIHAESELEESSEDDAYLRRERHHRSMHRTIQLPAGGHHDGTSATYRNGVLTVTIPVERDDDVHRIDVE
ncbi:Hsp20/alpha crystallin family protein [Haloplanus pelagicus]|uniref:Hsp20/alpha crystallin family protein n=1 Tax=Haloplanus pelagicus TaxID=2949995 RepID=UPI00203E283A|nr:Hsp20/alpha crystallin family protein [Haloplanus sp. HW8-1]